MASNDLKFTCACGEVVGKISDLRVGDGIRYVCHCDDCQVSAYVLGHPEALDANGGTSAALLNSSKLKIEKGSDQLSAIRVANIKSRPILRWHCSTCKTPLFNTYDSSRRSFLSFLLKNSDKSECDKLLGPSSGHVWKKYAVGDAAGLKNASIAAILARMVWRQISARLSGDYRNTPLFDRRTGQPIVPPRTISASEREAAEVAMARAH